MKKEQIKALKKISNELKAQFNLGKNGITDTFIETIDKYLKAHEIVKVKASLAANKSDIKTYSEDIAKQTNSQVVDLKGYTFVLYRENEDSN